MNCLCPSLESDSFLDNRQDYMEALERLGWPVPEKDIILLEEEMEKGERYIQKSEMLRRHIKEQQLGQSSANHRSKLTDSSTPRSFRSSMKKEAFDEVDKDSDEEEEENDEEKDSDLDIEDDSVFDKSEGTARSRGKSGKSVSDKDSLTSSSSAEEEDQYLSSEKDSHEEVDRRLQFLSI